jgi:rsbT co-antagonist protein RsbR
VEGSTPGASIEDFFSTCPEMLFVAGLDGRLLQVSGALRRALGLGDEAADTLGERVHPEDRDAFQAAWAQMSAGSEPAPIEVRLCDAQGAYRALSLRAARAVSGAAIHGCLRPAAGPTLKEQLLDTMATYLPVCIWAVDREGTFLYHYGKGLELIGLRQGHFVGMNVFSLYAGVEGADVHMRRAIAGDQIHYVDETHGTHWENWMVPMRGPEGDVRMVLGFTLDVSRTRRAEDDLRARLTQIEQQQETIQKLSTPIIEVWDGVLALPLLGVVDSVRTAEVMDNLLTRIVESRARFAILDLTGVEVVDTHVASHLIQLVSAIGLLGAEGIVAGIKSTVAQTMVTLGADLSQITTQRNLRAALGYCIRKMASTPRRAG